MNSSFLNLLFLFKLLSTVPICPPGFDSNQGSCWKLITTPTSQFNAETECLEHGGSALLAIMSGVVTIAVQAYIQNQAADRAWIGLKCNASLPSSCYWSYGRGTSAAYYNFIYPTMYPNITEGNCVYFETKIGAWFSQNCEEEMPFLCEVPMTTQDNCTNNYNHSCYFAPNDTGTFKNGSDACTGLCANLVSIHSELENRYVASLYQQPGSTRLGGVAPSRDIVIWSDSSKFLYNNIKNLNDGRCLYMDVTGNNTGDWFSDDCAKMSWYVCKRKTGITCS